VFPNNDNSLLPGEFVRVNIEGVTMPDAIAIPKAAITQGPQGLSSTSLMQTLSRRCVRCGWTAN
jgi:multidrug efflux pump subunit AcrA (membrane-fusion protein)